MNTVKNYQAMKYITNTLSEAELLQQLAEESAELAALKRETEGHRGERRALREQIAALRREADALRVESDALRSELKEKSAALDRLNRRIEYIQASTRERSRIW